METEELIKKLERLAELTEYYVIQEKYGKNKTIKQEATDELTNLQQETTDLFKEYNILEMIHPGRDEDFAEQWFPAMHRRGLINDVNTAVIHLKGLENE
ncbi:UNVERIFIED_CONTAM: hypothetical protein POZ17_09830 [Ralstonia mannitolilytica]